MGMPVDDQLLNATKDWIHKLCVGLLDALDAECKKVQSLVGDMKELVDLPIGENVRKKQYGVGYMAYSHILLR